MGTHCAAPASSCPASRLLRPSRGALCEPFSRKPFGDFAEPVPSGIPFLAQESSGLPIRVVRVFSENCLHFYSHRCLSKNRKLKRKIQILFLFFMHLVCGDVPLGGMSRRVFSSCLIPDFRNRNRMNLDCMCLFVRRLRLMLLCRLCENPLQKLCRMLLWKGLLQLSVLPSRSLRFEFSELARMLGGARHPSMRLSRVINCKPCAEFSFGREAPDV